MKAHCGGGGDGDGVSTVSSGGMSCRRAGRRRVVALPARQAGQLKKHWRPRGDHNQETNSLLMGPRQRGSNILYRYCNLYRLELRFVE